MNDKLLYCNSIRFAAVHRTNPFHAGEIGAVLLGAAKHSEHRKMQNPYERLGDIGKTTNGKGSFAQRKKKKEKSSQFTP
jgi:hypothetical protein